MIDVSILRVGSLVAAASGVVTYFASIPKLSPITGGAVAFLLYATKRIDDRLKHLDSRVDSLVVSLSDVPAIPPLPDEVVDGSA